MVEQKSTPNNFWGKKPALLLNPILWNLSFERPVKLPCGLSLFQKCLNGVTLDSWNCQSQNRDHSNQKIFSDKTQDKSFPTHFPCGQIELPHYTVPLCGMLLSKSRLAAIWFWPFNLFQLAFLKYLKVAMFCSNKCLKKYLWNLITKLVCCHVPSLHSGCSCRQ